MNIGKLKSIHSWVRGTPTSEIVFVSALILPLYLLMYNQALIQIDESLKIPGLIVALVLYIGGIIYMKSKQSRSETDINDLARIRNHILDKGFRFMSFEKIIEIDSSFTKDRVRELITAFPHDLRQAKLKGDKKGIKVLNVEEE